MKKKLLICLALMSISSLTLAYGSYAKCEVKNLEGSRVELMQHSKKDHKPNHIELSADFTGNRPINVEGSVGHIYGIRKKVILTDNDKFFKAKDGLRTISINKRTGEGYIKTTDIYAYVLSNTQKIELENCDFIGLE